MPKEYIHTDEFLTLGPDQRRSVYFALCEHALTVWENYAARRTDWEYVESVLGPRPPAAGTRQAVDQQLPAEALASARQGDDLAGVANRYLEPFTALQAGDLAFPGPVTFAYYAIYNLFRKYAAQAQVDDWLIVNQALAAEADPEVRRVLLSHAIQAAG